MASHVNLLIVDDNPVILGMLRDGFGSLATVTTCSNAAEALDASTNADLALIDFRMPEMDGRTLVEKLRSQSATENLPIIMMASKADQNERLGALRDSLEDFLDKPFFVKDVVKRIKRVIDRIALEKLARATEGGSTVRGTLIQMNVIDLLQSLELGRKSCKLTITSGAETCDMYFNEGQLADAESSGHAGAVIGDEAVYRALRFIQGNWEIDFSATSEKQTTTRSTQGLLMEGLRLFDEANRDMEEEAGEGTGEEENLLDV